MLDIKTAANFGQKTWDTEIIGVQLANGTTGLIAYNPNCKQNPYSNQVTGTSCLAILYDTDGFKTPNTSGKDLRGINVPSLGKVCAVELDGKCYSLPVLASPISADECEKIKDSLGIRTCYDNDYWAGAIKTCGGIDKLLETTKTNYKYVLNQMYELGYIQENTCFWRNFQFDSDNDTYSFVCRYNYSSFGSNNSSNNSSRHNSHNYTICVN